MLINKKDLPAPRLELRWQEPSGTVDTAFGNATIECVYLLIMPLREHDIRREDDNGNKVRSEEEIEMGKTYSTGTLARKVFDDRIDAPFRDGAHANWDSSVLGLPVYAVVGDLAYEVKPQD